MAGSPGGSRAGSASRRARKSEHERLLRTDALRRKNIKLIRPVANRRRNVKDVKAISTIPGHCQDQLPHVATMPFPKHDIDPEQSADNYVRQGVTSVMVGADGGSSVILDAEVSVDAWY